MNRRMANLCTPEVRFLREKLGHKVCPSNKYCRKSDEQNVDHLEVAKVTDDGGKSIVGFLDLFRFFNLQFK